MTSLSMDTFRQTLGGQLSISQHLLRISSVLGFLALSWLTAGLSGFVVGAVVGLVAFVVRPVVTVGLAHAGLLIIAPEFTGLASVLYLAAFEVFLLGIIGSNPTMTRFTLAVTGGFTVVLSTGIIAVFISTDVFLTSMLFLSIVGLFAYGIHRYERIALGLVAESSHDRQEDTL